MIKTVYKSFISCFIKPETGYQIDTARLIRGFISLKSFLGLICYLPNSYKISNPGLRDPGLLILFSWVDFGLLDGSRYVFWDPKAAWLFNIVLL